MKPNRGFSMIEVLVALTIVLVSVLGIAGLAVRTVQQESESYQQVQAVVLLQDMVDRINANRQAASCYSNGAAGRDLGGGSSTVTPCTAASAAQNTRANDDLQQWNDRLNGTAEQNGTANVGALIGARGCIRLVDASQQIYRITVAWQGLVATVAPGNTCGQNSYGSETKRRAVNAVVQIGKLT